MKLGLGFTTTLSYTLTMRSARSFKTRRKPSEVGVRALSGVHSVFFLHYKVTVQTIVGRGFQFVDSVEWGGVNLPIRSVQGGGQTLNVEVPDGGIQLTKSKPLVMRGHVGETQRVWTFGPEDLDRRNMP